MSVDPIDALGLRERKKLETRRALVSVTLELFAERGLNTTTVRAETLTASASHEARAVHLCGLSWVGAGEGCRFANSLLTAAPEPRRQRPRHELDSTSTGMPIGPRRDGVGRRHSGAVVRAQIRPKRRSARAAWMPQGRRVRPPCRLQNSRAAGAAGLYPARRLRNQLVQGLPPALAGCRPRGRGRVPRRKALDEQRR